MLVVLLGGCLAQPAAPQTWIGIYGPDDWSSPEVLRLEVGDAAWAIDAGEGVATPALTAATFIRVIGTESCETYASFEADPGSAHAIRFAADGSAEVRDVSGQPTAMGPGLVAAEPTRCPRG